MNAYIFLVIRLKLYDYYACFVGLRVNRDSSLSRFLFVLCHSILIFPSHFLVLSCIINSNCVLVEILMASVRPVRSPVGSPYVRFLIRYSFKSILPRSTPYFVHSVRFLEFMGLCNDWCDQILGRKDSFLFEHYVTDMQTRSNVYTLI